MVFPVLLLNYPFSFFIAACCISGMLSTRDKPACLLFFIIYLLFFFLRASAVADVDRCLVLFSPLIYYIAMADGTGRAHLSIQCRIKQKYHHHHPLEINIGFNRFQSTY